MTYRAPVADLLLALETAGHGALLQRGLIDLDTETLGAVLEAAGDMASGQLAPLNRLGDTHGARFDNGQVTSPPGFAPAYQAFCDGGWNGLSADLAHGGQGLSRTLELAVFEMVHAANMAFGLCPMLTQGAIEALAAHGSERQRRLILPKLVSGQWTGTMNLTEPQAGSDLAAISTRAEPDGAGGYRLSGQKIFITWGDHDLAENICHLVLARLPDAPPGVRGVSLFLSTKRLVDETGQLGALNSLGPLSIEHKLGIHGSPTCVMGFDGAQAELVGEADKGVAQMFVMMNAARLQVGMQGVGVAERAFQQALSFAQGRRQGRPAWGAQDAIYDHPDVRRTLLLMKAKIEAARGLCLATGVQADLARLSPYPAEQGRARQRQELLTPIAKAWSTDMAIEVASMGLQVHGGMGFIEETGAAQHYRDARIAAIYEGANGIQAIDLIARKIAADGGKALDLLIADIRRDTARLSSSSELQAVSPYLEEAVAALERATAWILAHPGAEALAVATPFLQLAGDVVGGWVLARQALATAFQADAWSQSKVALARLYASQVLTRAPGAALAVVEGAGLMAGVEAAALQA